jgi:hypothetical protein
MFDNRVVIPRSWKITPVLSATEVALQVHDFTSGAQWNEPVTQAEIAEELCEIAAINTGDPLQGHLDPVQGHLIELNSDISSLIN